MLLLIGTGIAFDLTLSAIVELKKCDEAYIETYTNPILDENIRKLEEIIEKKITKLKREEVEGIYLVKKAKQANIALLASGDPLTATTHVALIMDAMDNEIDTKVIHNSSIYTAAAGAAGLQIYRFGKTATLVNPREGYRPNSSLDVIRGNLKMDMHSLVLLDTEPEPMEAPLALEMLREFDTAVVLSRLGETDELVRYGEIQELSQQELGSPPFTIIIPAKLHIVEREYLEKKMKEKD
jgi:diphthine synthase